MALHTSRFENWQHMVLERDLHSLDSGIIRSMDRWRQEPEDTQDQELKRS
jgi:hypothetical protein